MSIFLDTGFFFAFHNSDDNNHKKAIEIAKPMEKGEFGAIFTSTYVIDEALTLSLSRFGHKKAIELGESILNSKIIALDISKTLLEGAWKLFKERKNLSFTDCTTILLIAENKIANLCTFDSDFRQFREINVLG